MCRSMRGRRANGRKTVGSAERWPNLPGIRRSRRWAPFWSAPGWVDREDSQCAGASISGACLATCVAGLFESLAAACIVERLSE